MDKENKLNALSDEKLEQVTGGDVTSANIVGYTAANTDKRGLDSVLQKNPDQE